MDTSTRSFTCLACSKPLEFNAGSVSTRCTMCEDERPLPLRFGPDVPAVALDADAASSAALPGHTHARCGACGTLLSSATALAECPLCGGEPVVVSDTPALLVVHGWLPFLVDEYSARALLTATLERLGMPTALTRFAGIHAPWLVYECVLKGTYDGRRGDYEQTGDGQRLVWHAVSGAVDRMLENRRASASRSIVGELADRLEPWDWAFVESLSASATAVVCERCELDPSAVAARAMPDSTSGVIAEVRSEIGGDAQEVRHVESRRERERFRHVLLPVWFGTLAGSDVRVAVNGRTGEVVEPGHLGLAPEESELEPETGANYRIIVGVVLAIAFLAFVFAQ